MKDWSSDAMAAIDAGTAVAHGAIYIATAPDPVAIWGGYEPRDLPDGNTYQGIGDRGLVSVSGAQLGGAEQNITLSLSGVEPHVIAVWDEALVRNVPVVLWRLIFDLTGRNLLDAQVYTRGKLDQLLKELDQGGTYTISALIEGAARGLGRSGGRIATGADQRLIDPDDGSLDQVSAAPQKTLYWGGLKPAPAGSALQQQVQSAAQNTASLY